jgi:hypothetical protein
MRIVLYCTVSPVYHTGVPQRSRRRPRSHPPGTSAAACTTTARHAACGEPCSEEVWEDQPGRGGLSWQGWAGLRQGRRCLKEGCVHGWRFRAKASNNSRSQLAVQCNAAGAYQQLSNNMRSQKSRFASVKFGWLPKCCHAGVRFHSRLVALAARAIL